MEPFFDSPGPDERGAELNAGLTGVLCRENVIVTSITSFEVSFSFRAVIGAEDEKDEVTLEFRRGSFARGYSGMRRCFLRGVVRRGNPAR